MVQDAIGEDVIQGLGRNPAHVVRTFHAGNRERVDIFLVFWLILNGLLCC